VGRYQKGKTNLDFTGARDSEWQWHQLGHMQVRITLQTDNHTSTPPLSFYRPDAFLPPNKQRQSTEGNQLYYSIKFYDKRRIRNSNRNSFNYPQQNEIPRTAMIHFDFGW